MKEFQNFALHQKILQVCLALPENLRSTLGAQFTSRRILHINWIFLGVLDEKPKFSISIKKLQKLHVVCFLCTEAKEIKFVVLRAEHRKNMGRSVGIIKKCFQNLGSAR